jgi:hypothetical protein
VPWIQITGIMKWENDCFGDGSGSEAHLMVDRPCHGCLNVALSEHVLVDSPVSGLAETSVCDVNYWIEIAAAELCWLRRFVQSKAILQRAIETAAGRIAEADSKLAAQCQSG